MSSEERGNNGVGTTPPRTSLTQVLAASVVGTSLEWYDFYLYGTAAALVFNRLFFPKLDPLAGTLAAFGTYALGFVARPLGGIVFGHFGDKLGRKTMLVITLTLMGIATTLIGLLPTYKQAGVLAPLLLVFLRVVQGLGAGAEFGGAVLMAAEYAPPTKRGFYASLPGTGVSLGVLLSSGLVAVFSSLPRDQFLSWGWRIPFLLSIVVVLVGIYVRMRVMETPEFTDVKAAGAEARMPILDLLREQPRELLVAMGARVAENGSAYLLQVFSLTYLSKHLGLPDRVGLMGVLVASALGLATIPAFGALSDRLGRRPVYLFGAAGLGLFAFPFFSLLDTKNPLLIGLALIIAISIFYQAMFGPQGAFLAELFNTRVRYSGIATAREVSAVFAGGVAPVIATALLARSRGAFWPIAVYLIAMCAITVVALLLAPETYRRTTRAVGPGPFGGRLSSAQPIADRGPSV